MNRYLQCDSTGNWKCQSQEFARARFAPRLTDLGKWRKVGGVLE